MKGRCEKFKKVNKEQDILLNDNVKEISNEEALQLIESLLAQGFSIQDFKAYNENIL